MDEVARESASEEGPPTPAVSSLRAAGCSWASGPGPPWGLRPLGPPGHLGRVPALAKAAVMSSVPTSLPSSVSAEPSPAQRSQEALVGPSASGLTASGGPRGAPWEGPGVHAWPLPRAGPALHCPPHQPQAHPLPALVCRAFSSLPGEHRFLPDHRCCGPSLHLGSPRTWGSFELGCQGPRPLTPLRLKASGGLVSVFSGVKSHLHGPGTVPVRGTWHDQTEPPPGGRGHSDSCPPAGSKRGCHHPQALWPRSTARRPH